MSHQRELDHLNHKIRMQSWFILGLFGVILLLGLMWMMTKTQITARTVPPLNLPGTYRTGEMPPIHVYQFAQSLIARLNLWLSNGQEEYRDRIESLHYFLTPRCRQILNNDYQSKNGRAELLNRTRVLQPIPGQSFDPSSVVQKGPRSWEVPVDFLLLETVAGRPVKQDGFRWVARIELDESKPDINLYGLALNCFSEGPLKISRQYLIDEYGIDVTELGR